MPARKASPRIRPPQKDSNWKITTRFCRPGTKKLLEAFEIADIEVDVNAVLSLAGVAAHSIVRPAAPVTTFVAGLAAGLAAGMGQTSEANAMAAALGMAKKLAAAEAPAAPASPVATDTLNPAGN
ncbi:DUF6457 domain-containing protein [Arthrobacter psychrolactophilus]